MELKQLFGTLVAVLVGSLLAWLGTYIADQRRISRERIEKLRSSYSAWFALCQIAMMRGTALRQLIEDSVDNRDQYLDVAAEAKAFSAIIEDLVKSLHAVLFLERIEQVRRTLYAQTEVVLKIYFLIHNQLGLLQLIAGCRERAATLRERLRDIPSALEEHDRMSDELIEAQMNIEVIHNDLVSKIRSGNATTAEDLARVSKALSDLAMTLSAHFES